MTPRNRPRDDDRERVVVSDRMAREGQLIDAWSWRWARGGRRPSAEVPDAEIVAAIPGRTLAVIALGSLRPTLARRPDAEVGERLRQRAEELSALGVTVDDLILLTVPRMSGDTPAERFAAILPPPWEVHLLDGEPFTDALDALDAANRRQFEADTAYGVAISGDLDIDDEEEWQQEHDRRKVRADAADDEHSRTLAALQELVWRTYRPDDPTRSTRRLAKRPEPLPDVVHFRADRVHAGTVQAFGRVAEWGEGVAGFWRALSVTESAAYSQVVGFYRDPGAELWAFLRERGNAAIKAHYALWARCYETTDADPHQWVTLDVPQFCHDLGYAKQKAGGYKTRDKQQAMRVLEVLTTTELAVEARVGRKVVRMRGPIWTRGLAAEQRDEYGDLFGSARAGERELWEPVGFTYRPGQWFEDAEWRKHNEFVGMVGVGLLRLDNRDTWPLRIGGYYGTLARFGGYADRAISAGTVLARTGLARLDARHSSKQRDNFERAHDRLVEVGVLRAWEWATDPVTDEPDMDDPAALAELANYAAGDCRRQGVRLTWPDLLSREAERLRTAKQRRITAARRRRSARPKGSTA